MEPELLETTIRPCDQWPALVKAHAFADPAVVLAFSENTVESLAWLKTSGVKFDQQYPPIPTRSQPRIAPVGGGLEIVERLAAAAENIGYDLDKPLYVHPIISLL